SARATVTTRALPVTAATPDRVATSVSTATVTMTASTAQVGRTARVRSAHGVVPEKGMGGWAAGAVSRRSGAAGVGAGHSGAGGRWQCHHHSAAGRQAAFVVDRAAVEVDDPAGDRKAEAGAAGLARPSRVRPVEPFEDPARVGVGDAGAVVGDGKGDTAPRMP